MHLGSKSLFQLFLTVPFKYKSMCHLWFLQIVLHVRIAHCSVVCIIDRLETTKIPLIGDKSNKSWHIEAKEHHAATKNKAGSFL